MIEQRAALIISPKETMMRDLVWYSHEHQRLLMDPMMLHECFCYIPMAQHARSDNLEVIRVTHSCSARGTRVCCV